MRPVAAGALAAACSGIPSTAWALVRGDDALAAARAAGTLLPGRRHRPSLVGGVVAHVTISAVWTGVFAMVGRRRRWGPASGAVAGLAIAALDLGVIGRRYRAIAALPVGPQLADHAAFGALLGTALGATNRSPGGRSSSCPSG